MKADVHGGPPASIDTVREVLGLDRVALDRARLSRDPRCDGRFFIAVTSTGIYCRPICPSRSSKSANVRYYASAAQAAEAGFRPCLRCRPEAAPGTPAWLGTSAVVRRALKLIDEGLLDDGSVAGLAARLGIGPRHLLRLFKSHVGASPATVAHTRRLHFAKRLLDESTLPITEIALASGFRSVRRFNAAFRETYGRAPRDVRRCAPGDDGDVLLRLAHRAPYDWEHAWARLAAGALPGVARVADGEYQRLVPSERGAALVSLRPLGDESAVALRVTGASPRELFALSSAARRVLDLAADPARIAAALADDPDVGPRVKARPGLRIIGAWNPLELGLTTLVDGAEAARIVAALGRPVDGYAPLMRLAPTAAQVARADLVALGVAPARAAALRDLARLVADGAAATRATMLPEDLVDAAARCASLPAGFATALALFAFADPDAFSPALLPNAGAALLARAERWQPWRGYALVHLADPR